MVACPLCNQEVDWVTAEQAARILGVSRVRVMQFIDADRLPGAVKREPQSGVSALWTVPIDSLLALVNFRRKEQGLSEYVS